MKITTTDQEFHTIQMKLGVAPSPTDEIRLDGVKLRGVRDVKVVATMETATEVTITLIANIEALVDALVSARVVPTTGVEPLQVAEPPNDV